MIRCLQFCLVGLLLSASPGTAQLARGGLAVDPRPEDQQRFGAHDLYAASTNPALLVWSHPAGFTWYQFSYHDQRNAWRRTYEPARENNTGLLFNSAKLIDDRTILAAGTYYSRFHHMRTYRSLEQDFYNHYFAFSDTTTGNVNYEGPQVWALIDFELLPRLRIGGRIDYAVQRGLKDVYTKCETIHREVEIGFGGSWQNRARSRIVGVQYRYGDRRRQYESVKEMQDALVYVFIGYHVMRREHPRSTSIKIDERVRHAGGFQFEQRRLLGDRVSLRLTGDYDATNGRAQFGPPSLLWEYGYWVAETYSAFLALEYLSRRREGVLLEVGGAQKEAWARSLHRVVVLEDHQQQLVGRLLVTLRPAERARLIGGLQRNELRNDYHEYNRPFVWNRPGYERTAFARIEIPLDPVLTVMAEGLMGRQQTDFRWEATCFDIRSIGGGCELLTVQGTIRVLLQHEIRRPVIGRDARQNTCCMVIFQR